MTQLPELTVYSRRGCHLCELLVEELVPLCRGRARIVMQDVDERPEWRARFGERIPVVCVGEQEICAVTLDPDAVLGALDSGNRPGSTPEA